MSRWRPAVFVAAILAVAVVAWLVTLALRELPLRSEREALPAVDKADAAQMQAAGAAD